MDDKVHYLKVNHKNVYIYIYIWGKVHHLKVNHKNVSYIETKTTRTSLTIRHFSIFIEIQ